jgi:hypothetical protein
MIASSVAKRAGTPDEVGNVSVLLMGPDGTFIIGSDILMDGGVTATYCSEPRGRRSPERPEFSRRPETVTFAA